MIGGALGALNAAMLAGLGYRVALVERIQFGRMNREWNISRQELQTLVDVGLFTPTELESLILREYQDNFNVFFSGNSPPHAKAPVLHTPTLLNIAMDCDLLLSLCGEKLRAAGGQIFDYTEFEQGLPRTSTGYPEDPQLEDKRGDAPPDSVACGCDGDGVADCPTDQSGSCL